MRKRARQTSADSRGKALIEDEILEDWTGQLPDDILVNIISRLTLKEAARTSVLSSRWKNLWTFITSLNFEAPESDFNVWRGLAAMEFERSKFINRVNKVLELHRGSNISEFRIRFNLCDSHESVITDWIYIALAKRVQNFELDLRPGMYKHDYTFPLECCDSLRRSGHGLSSVKSLRSLHFNTVNVTGEVVEFFMQNCPLLNRICVIDSSALLSIKVVGSSVKLKHLDIQSCYFLKKIEISAPSLVSFKYYGREIKLLIENVPQLVDVSIRGCVFARITYFISPIVCCFPQLKTLELDSCSKVYTQFSQCELPNLIHLKLRVTTPNRESVLGLTGIMNACPFLQKLILQVDDHGRRLGKKRNQFPKYPHQHLKVAELHGFLGRQFDLEVAFYLLQNATMLEKLIVEPSKYIRKKALRNCVKMLEAKLPKGVELVVGALYVADFNPLLL